MIRHSSKTLLSDSCTGSIVFESYVTHFELLSQIQKWQKIGSKRRRDKN